VCLGFKRMVERKIKKGRGRLVIFAVGQIRIGWQVKEDQMAGLVRRIIKIK